MTALAPIKSRLVTASLALSAFAACLTLPALSHAQGAAAQKLVADQSQVTFTFRQMGVPVEGRFRQFEVQSQFDPTKPEQSRVSLRIPLASATIGDAATDAELVKAPWFNTAKFPQAIFQSSSIKALGGGQYSMVGKLAIKGQSQDVTVPVQLTQSGNLSTATGQFSLKRLTYRIGENEWADTSMVADDVQVKFKFVISGIGRL